MSSTALHQQNAPLFQYAKSQAFTKLNELLILTLTNPSKHIRRFIFRDLKSSEHTYSFSAGTRFTFKHSFLFVILGRLKMQCSAQAHCCPFLNMIILFGFWLKFNIWTVTIKTLCFAPCTNSVYPFHAFWIYSINLEQTAWIGHRQGVTNMVTHHVSHCRMSMLITVIDKCHWAN